MKCPLILKTFRHLSGGDTVTVGDCLEEKCAWWDTEAKKCAALSMLGALRWISRLLSELKNKMPPEEQFRK